MNGLNLSNIQDAKLGSSQVTALYYGSTLIWQHAHDYSLDYLTIEPTEDNDYYGVDLMGFKSSADAPNVTLSYSKDLINWNSVTINSTATVSIEWIEPGEKLYLKGINETFGYSENDFVSIYAGDNYKVSGNIMSLLYGDNFVNQDALLNNYTFCGLFKSATNLSNKLIDASNLILPATTLTPSCYRSLFDRCLSLTAAPATLPATTLTDSCYRSMFYNCTSLTDIPATLPATTLVDSCYRSMFDRCESLTTAPLLPATTLADDCYRSMFYFCESLTDIPATLPATTLALNCYYYMFRGCTRLTTAPVLPARTLVSGCYSCMFQECSSLNWIKAMFTTTPSTSYTNNWVSGVAASGTYIKNISATYTTRGKYAIPTGWTLQTASS